MKKEKALDKFDPLRNRDYIHDFIEKLYKENYIILTPEEHKKVNDAIVIADIHGMNPFVDYGKKYGKNKYRITSGMAAKMRCSIACCPWRARHYFTGGYQECWFHYEEMPLVNWAWELFNYPIRKFFFWVRFRVCGNAPKGVLLYHVDWKFLLIPRLSNKNDIA